MKISFDYSLRNDAAYSGFVDSLWRRTWTGWEIEILVADGMSDDGTARSVVPVCGQMRPSAYHDTPARIVSTELNAAIREAAGDIVIRMDAHRFMRGTTFVCVKGFSESGSG